MIAPAAYAAPPNGDEWLVSVGASYISGEAGRWAGNSSHPAQTDALGDAAYLDAGQSESNEVRTASTAFSDYSIQESLHPNYWGQLARRNCLRQVYNDGAVRSGSCTAGAGLTPAGEPAVTVS